MPPKSRKSNQQASLGEPAPKTKAAERTSFLTLPVVLAVGAATAAIGAAFFWASPRTAAPAIEPDARNDDPHSEEAVKLALLINHGGPINIVQHMSPSELDMALGELQPTTLGWRRRAGSFIDLLDQSLPEVWDEAELAHIDTDVFAGPLVVKRTAGGVSSVAAEHMSVASLGAANPTTRPSRCAALAVNFGPKPRTEDGEWNTDMMPNINCPECQLSFSDFADIAMRPFDLSIPSHDERNSNLQTHGVLGEQLKWLEDVFSKRDGPTYHHDFLDKNYFHPGCLNPPAMGFAGSLRGLPFHAHQANWNEAVVGRKLFAFFPPRTASSSDNLYACPFPPWKPKGAEVKFPPIEAMLESFLEGSFNASESTDLKLRSCHDQSMTPIQWLVYEMPKLPKEHRPLLFVLHPGELVWIPDNWLHLTVNIDDAVYTYAAACEDAPNSGRYAPARLAAGAKRVCERTGHFCQGYCHTFCRSCKGRKCDCPAMN